MLSKNIPMYVLASDSVIFISYLDLLSMLNLTTVSCSAAGRVIKDYLQALTGGTSLSLAFMNWNFYMICLV